MAVRHTSVGIIDTVGIEQRTNLLEQGSRHNSIVIAWMGSAAVDDLAKVDAIAEHLIKRTTTEMGVASALAIAACTRLRSNIVLGQLCRKSIDRSKIEIAFEDMADALRFVGNRNELSLLDLVPEVAPHRPMVSTNI